MSLKNLDLRPPRTALLPLALLSGLTTACNRPLPVQAQTPVQPQIREAEISLPGPNVVQPAAFHCAADENLVYTCHLTEGAKQAYLQAHPKPPKLPPILPTLMPIPATLPGFKAPASFSCNRLPFEMPLETAYECISPWETAAVKRARAAQSVSSLPSGASYRPSR